MEEEPTQDPVSWKRLRALLTPKSLAIFVLVVIICLTIMVIVNSSLFIGERKQRGDMETLWNPTAKITLYYKPDCIYCKQIMPEWYKFVNNIHVNRNINIETVNCGDPLNISKCIGLKGVPTIIKQQMNGRTYIFEGNHTSSNYYHFATHDY